MARRLCPPHISRHIIPLSVPHVSVSDLHRVRWLAAPRPPAAASAIGLRETGWVQQHHQFITLSPRVRVSLELPKIAYPLLVKALSVISKGHTS